jgi:hypothetical protein
MHPRDAAETRSRGRRRKAATRPRLDPRVNPRAESRGLRRPSCDDRSDARCGGDGGGRSGHGWPQLTLSRAWMRAPFASVAARSKAPRDRSKTACRIGYQRGRRRAFTRFGEDSDGRTKNLLGGASLQRGLLTLRSSVEEALGGFGDPDYSGSSSVSRPCIRRSSRSHGIIGCMKENRVWSSRSRIFCRADFCTRRGRGFGRLGRPRRFL